MTTHPPKRKSAVPPLENGDRLTRAEFERRYHAMPQVKKAELIEGVVHMPSPVRFDQHAWPHFNTIGWLGQYAALTPGVLGGDNGTIRLDTDNEPQPDVFLFIDPQRGGQAGIDDEGYVVHGPELVVEISASTASYDLHTKMTVYRRNGVREYVVWRVQDGEIDWFVLRDGRYEPLPADADGISRSEIFPGLWLDRPALLRGDLAAVFDAVRRGCSTPEHAVFVQRLRT